MGDRDDIDQYGRGDLDPVTGLYEWYDLPPGALDTGGGSADLLEVLEQWGLVEFDFQHLLGLDLDGLRHTMTWRRFKVLLAGLFGVEKSLVRHHFNPDQTHQEVADDE